MKALALLFTLAVDRPELVSGKLEPLGPAANLTTAVEALRDKGWAGYSVPMTAGSHDFCGNGGVVRLDSAGHSHTSSKSRVSGDLFILLRLESGRATEIVVLSAGCRIDVRGGALRWWEPVAPRESLRYLREVALSAKDEDLMENAVHAAAMHFDSAASELLDELARSAPSRDVREKAIFWLGAARGEEGFRKLSARFKEERDTGLREEMVFAMHLSKAEGAIPRLIQIARKDRSPDVREKALFWLGQRAGRVAARAIADATREDPDREVKKKAVFALSQLPEEEGIPLLVEVAETHPDPEVREQAFFWLGQTGDPRAIDLFEKVLLRK
jgi:HEAT repeat protein